MPFKQKFTEEDVVEAIKYYSDFITAAKLAEHIGCSLQTIKSLLEKLEKKECVASSNHGTEARPAILWKRTAKAIQNR